MSRCKRCGAAIVWLRTIKGNLMPCNAGAAHDREIFDLKKGNVSHWSTCPHAKESRNANRNKSAHQKTVTVKLDSIRHHDHDAGLQSGRQSGVSDKPHHGHDWNPKGHSTDTRSGQENADIASYHHYDKMRGEFVYTTRDGREKRIPEAQFIVPPAIPPELTL